jgi:hypothetical protein
MPSTAEREMSGSHIKKVNMKAAHGTYMVLPKTDQMPEPVLFLFPLQSSPV